MIPIMLAVLVLAAPAAVSAAPAGGGQGSSDGFKLYSSYVTYGVDNGVGTVAEAAGTELEADDNVFVLVPGAVAYTRSSPRSGAQFIYQPELEIFQTRGELNAINHAAAARYTRRATQDLTITTGASFLHTHDRSRTSSSLAVSSRGLFVEGRAGVSIDYRIGRSTTMSARLDSALTQTAVTPVESSSGSIDELTSSFSAGLARGVGRSHSLSIGYAHLESDVLNPRDLPRSDDVGAGRPGVDTLNLAYRMAFDGGLQMSGSAGAIRLPQAEGSNQYTYSLAGRLEKTWRSLTMGGGYLRTISGLLRLVAADPADQPRDPLLSRSVAETVDFRVAGDIGRRFRLNQMFGWARTQRPGTDQHVESFFAVASIGLVLVDRVVPFINVSHLEQPRTDLTRGISRTRIQAGFQLYLWSSPPQPGRSLGHEAARAILPIRQGH